MIGLHALAIMLIAVASSAAAIRVLRHATRWRWPLALGQLAAGALLYLLLFPPLANERGDSLTVLTPGTTIEQLADSSAATRIALPGIALTVDSRIERSPDLATALRRHPQTTQLRVIGHGLPARDRDAARGLAIAFEPSALLDGIVELALPSRVQVGNRFRIAGRVQSSTPGSVTVELRDPADAVAATTKADADGRFELDGLARVGGVAHFSLRLLDAAGKDLERVPVMVDARSDEPIRLLLLAAVPSPELKYLRRWASDAGLVVDSRIGLSDGVSITAGASKPIDAALLATQDLLVVDERRWLQLDSATKTAIIDAVDGGLGLLLRVTGPLSPELLAAWSALGIDLPSIDNPQPAALADDERDDAPLLTRAPYRLPTTWATLAATRSGDALIAWQARGRGRVAVSVLADSYRDVLGGAPDRHGSLWSRVATTLSRARAEAQPQLPAFARVGERASLCGLVGDGWSIDPRDRPPTRLLPDRANGDCAAFWPTDAGTHRLVHGGSAWPFDVMADDVAMPLQAALTQTATAALAGASTASGVTSNTTSVPRVVWLLAWLLTMAALWWVERRAWMRGRD